MQNITERISNARLRWAASYKLADIPTVVARMKRDLDRARSVGNVELTEWLEQDMNLLLERLHAEQKPMIHR